MNRKLNITVMLGGPSAEREVSLRSGAGVVKALRSLGHGSVNWIRKMHGFCRENGRGFSGVARHLRRGRHGAARSLDELGVLYTGCDSEASRIAFDKVLTKQRCIEAGVPTAKFLVVNSEKTPWPKDWQPPLVVKPVRQGSSVGLQFVERVEDWPKCAGGGVEI